VLANQGVYPLTLQASVDAQTITGAFQVEISDPCKRAVFEVSTTPALAPMVLIRDFDSAKTQSFKVTTDVEATYGLICNYVASLTPTWTYVSLAGSTASYTITAYPVPTVLADVGVHAISISVVSLEYSATVATEIYTFDLTIQHCVVNTMSIPSISDYTHRINDSPLSMVFSPATWSDLICDYDATYTLSFVLNSVSISQPSFIAFDALTRTITATATLPAHMGVYSVTVTASIPQPSLGVGGTKQVSMLFILNVLNDCPSTILNDLSILDMSVKVSLSSTQDVTFTNTKSVTYADPIFCGPRLFTWTPSLPSYLSLNAGLTTLTLATNNPSDRGVFTALFIVSLQDYPMVPSITKNFQVTIICEVFTLAYFTAPANMIVEPDVTV